MLGRLGLLFQRDINRILCHSAGLGDGESIDGSCKGTKMSVVGGACPFTCKYIRTDRTTT